MEPPSLFVTLPPASSEMPSDPLPVPLIVPLFVTVPEPPVSKPPYKPEITPELLRAPVPPSSIPHPPSDETVPLLAMVQAVLAAPSTPSLSTPVEVIVPVLVMVRGLSEGLSVKGPVIEPVIFSPTLITPPLDLAPVWQANRPAPRAGQSAATRDREVTWADTKGPPQRSAPEVEWCELPEPRQIQHDRVNLAVRCTPNGCSGFDVASG